MKKAILKITGLAALAALMMYNVQSGKGSDVSTKDLTLDFFKNMAIAECEVDPDFGGGLPPVDCTRVWCQSTYSYSGCGLGNSQVTCNDSELC